MREATRAVTRTPHRCARMKKRRLWMRTFREEPLARPCVSVTEPSNSRPENPYMRVPETPPNALGRGSRFWQMMRRSARHRAAFSPS
jgi:hypothetical protein